ncbi:hypothetical protein CEXT_162181 [Caerostris extrusa]|uniref:Uncharacterized protein n=1 Tax=Caerostris extrusa TaxID=172846 RepID=A0AAV4TTP6_CAEEX|nr:hypothetical protein CEXT_162181 [Caerostris extrusa]
MCLAELANTPKYKVWLVAVTSRSRDKPTESRHQVVHFILVWSNLIKTALSFRDTSAYFKNRLKQSLSMQRMATYVFTPELPSVGPMK